MNSKLIELHEEIYRCQRCYPKILVKDRNIRRPGFPPNGQYTIIVIGCEPGNPEDQMTEEEYRKHFFEKKDHNTVRRLFDAFKKEKVTDMSNFFYTNAVKCPAAPGKESQRCYEENCHLFLEKQIQAINPRLIVVFGRAAKMILGKGEQAPKGQFFDRIFNRYPCIVLTHPQGAKCSYLDKVARHVKKRLAN